MRVEYADDGLFHRGGWGPDAPWLYPRQAAILNLKDEIGTLGQYIYTDMETNFTAVSALRFTKQFYNIAFVAVACYVAALYFGQKYMKKRQPYDLRGPLKFWNLGLAVFSAWGCFRTLPHLLLELRKFGFATTLCGNAFLLYGQGSSGVATLAFVWSKYFELIDTAFLVLRKRPVNFLHWFHHSTVLLYTWDAYAEEQPAGIYFIAINYTVHSIMYFYYYLAATMAKPPKWSVFVTSLQLAQMVVGIFVTSFGLFYASHYPMVHRITVEEAANPIQNGVCLASRWNLGSACLLYASYFYLFAQFFVNRYWSKSQSKKAGAVASAGITEKTSQAPAMDEDAKTEGRGRFNDGATVASSSDNETASIEGKRDRSGAGGVGLYSGSSEETSPSGGSPAPSCQREDISEQENKCEESADNMRKRR